MGDILGYARVSTGDQDVAGQRVRLEQAGALKIFTDVRSGRSLDRPGWRPWWPMPAQATRWPLCASTALADPSLNC